jgi:hypothetical protein
VPTKNDAMAQSHSSRTHSRAWSVAAGFALVLGCVTLQPARAQDNDDWNTGSSKLQCTPDCRSGYRCIQGECLPICSPQCEPGFLCTAGGACVRATPQTPPPEPSSQPQVASSTNQCLPSCRPGYVCLQGQCVSACNPLCAEGEMCSESGECVPASSQPEAPTPPPDPSAKSVVNVHFDALGLLQFGLTPTVEFGKRFSGFVRLRVPNTGMLSYLLVPRSDDMKFQWGLGGAIGGHFFSSKKANMRGVFGGPALEYLFMRTRDETRRKAVYGTHVLIPQLDLGYRWAFGSFLLGLGGRVGLSIPVAKYDDPIGKMGCHGAGACKEERPLLFVAGLFLDLGVFL